MTTELDTPRGNRKGFVRYFRQDLLAGFLVFLIALPLCLGIALAYGFPPIAGVFTAIIGGLVAPLVSNSELTIKGPAAGLIAIAAPCVMSFGWSGVPGELNIDAYRAALAVGVAAGVLQIVMGLLRVGSLGEFFPSAVVHGMLAAIGVIIVLKMFPQAVGVKVGGEPLVLLRGLPEIIRHLNPMVAVVGGVSLAIMFLWPLVQRGFLRSIPAALVVLAVAIPLSRVVQLEHQHTNSVVLEAHEGSLNTRTSPAVPAEEGLAAKTADVPESDALIHVPAFGETFSALTLPKFSALAQPQAWRWVFMFAIIGTLESMLSAKAMDMIDASKRRTSLDRDNIAVGIGNILCAMVGAAPMISEIVRSRANLDNGARTRFANFYHGAFLLLFVSLLPFVVGMIPVAALMAMLVYTGYRLAHPKEFAHVYEVGPEQLLVFCSTMVGCFAIDLLAGVGIGIGVKILIHLINGAPLRSVFKPHIEQGQHGAATLLKVHDSLIFSNWLSLRRRLERASSNASEVVLDLSHTRLVDHTVMSNLGQLQRQWNGGERQLIITGLEEHRTFSQHPESARKKRFQGMH